MGKITVRELAKLAGVSPSAISVVLNDRPGVSDETRERILSLLKQYNYTLKPRKESTVAKLRIIKYRAQRSGERELFEDFFSTLMDALADECHKQRFTTIITSCNEDNVSETFAEILNNPTDGLFLIGHEFAHECLTILAPLKQQGIPMVIFDNGSAFKDINNFSIDNANVAFNAITYLYERNHRDIGFITSASPDYPMTERKKGFLEALKFYHLEFQPFIKLTPTIDGAYRDMKKYIEEGNHIPKAGFAGNDIIALGSMQALHEAGFKIPDDVSIIGVDDIAVSSISLPPLTTLRMPIDCVVDLMISVLKMNLTSTYPHIHTQIGMHIVERASVKDLRPLTK